MTATSAGATQWHRLRHELHGALDRFVSLLRTTDDPHAPAVGGWTVAEVAAHVVVVCSLNVHTSSGGEVPFVAPAALPLVPTVNVDRVADINALAATVVTERRLDVLADEITALVDGLLRRTADADPAALWPWLGGARVTTAFLLCHTLNELLVHGHDIATAAVPPRPWVVPEPLAALVFEVFLLGLLRGDSGVLFTVPSYPPGRVRARVHSAHHTPVTLVAERGRLTVDDSGGPVDLHLWARPSTLMLVLWRRTGVLRPVLTGRLRLWGRRPWLAPRFLASARNP